MTPDDFLELMLVDKKVIDGRLRLVLLKGVGNAVVTEDFEQTQLVHCLDEMCGNGKRCLGSYCLKVGRAVHHFNGFTCQCSLKYPGWPWRCITPLYKQAITKTI